jgi:hypothetical protein
MPVPLVEDVLNTARMFLNDNSATPQLWTDAVLLPMFQRAFQELQTTLKQRAAPIMKSYAAPISVTAGQVTLTTPSDITSPIQLWEAASGGTFTPMTEADPLPLNTPVGPMLNWWHWDGGEITLLGATTNRVVQLLYWRDLTVPVSSGSSVGIIDGDMWLAPRTAAIAAASVGEENTSAMAAANAAEYLEKVILSNRGRSPQDAGISIRP